MSILNYAGSNKILRILFESKGEYSTLAERLDVLEEGSGGGAGVSNQVTKLGVTATPESPYIEEIAITQSIDFLLGAAEVLKFVAGTENVVQTICNFDNADASSFEANDFVVFDGVMKLKTQDTFAMTDDGALGSGKVFSHTFNKTLFNTQSISIA
jgi:hypothetical protein